jgi:hypothetical protein
MTDLQREIHEARRIQQMLESSGYVTLAEAARAAHVPATTLADAVKRGRLPAVRVKSNRWLVRLEAVQLVFNSAKGEARQSRADRELARAGLLNVPRGGYTPLRYFQPIDFGGRDSSELDPIVRARMERERAVSG